MAFRHVERAFRKIHRSSRPQRCGKMLVELSHGRRWFSRGHGGGKTVQDRSRFRSVIAGQSRGHLSGISEKPVSLVELVLRYELAAIVDGLRVLLDGNTNDTGKTFCRVFLGGQSGCGRDR